ncbi:2,3-bisphosphoglycerate-dependent phosphoglycerate mutase [Propionispora sp. 2/2-37]|uniref:2,3-diphosphoglycerate-dependent phosphoglycerate mutase n=1 Tax=Propionispora sp. 2/2-37 TaxID=1677858 RepID=UPI0006BB6BD4|nr:2,3-diphosphoglycerate-dependent phosphoglycerate mutase [Propionispora sp. 2/2-37]CUH94706.1 2,3-bisphosphoglycerate-dependent phosphoglycerate mutase [Propionispora sp. 2/2-37]
MSATNSTDYTYRVVFIRHGQSEWNRTNRFTGWTDVDLTAEGVDEARKAGKLLHLAGYQFDKAITSCLKRAIKTMHIVLEEMDQLWIPEYKTWKLNERHYGALQGRNKAETAQIFGDEQVKIWRRSYDIAPPALSKEDPRFPGHDVRYAAIPQDQLPATESLKDTEKRVIAYWQETLTPEILQGRSLLVVAHGNSLRSLVRHIDKISPDNIMAVEIPTGIPLVYEFAAGLQPLRSYYLQNP